MNITTAELSPQQELKDARVIIAQQQEVIARYRAKLSDYHYAFGERELQARLRQRKADHEHEMQDQWT